MRRLLLRMAPLVIMFAGCATPRVPVRPEVWNNNKIVIGVAIARPVETGFAQYGGWMAFFDPMKNERIGKMLEFFKSVNLSKFDDVANEFVKRLKAKKMRVRMISDYIDLDEYKLMGKYDFGRLAKSEKIDALIILRIESFGTLNSYVFNKPIGNPSVYVRPMAFMLDFRNGGTIYPIEGTVGREWLLNRTFTRIVSDDWDQPPRYYSMNNTLDSLLMTVKGSLINDFFGQ